MRTGSTNGVLRANVAEMSILFTLLVFYYHAVSVRKPNTCACNGPSNERLMSTFYHVFKRYLFFHVFYVFLNFFSQRFLQAC